MIRRRILLGALLGVLFAAGWWAGRGRASSDLYANTDLFLEILHAVQTSYVDPVDVKPLITNASVKELGLCVGRSAIVLVKAPFVIIAPGETPPAAVVLRQGVGGVHGGVAGLQGVVTQDPGEVQAGILGHMIFEFDKGIRPQRQHRAVDVKGHGVVRHRAFTHGKNAAHIVRFECDGRLRRGLVQHRGARPDQREQPGRGRVQAEREVAHAVEGIYEVAAIGVPDDRLGERIVAYVVLEAGASVPEETLLERCGDQLARYKVPREVRFLDALPRNATGKIDRRRLRDLGRESQ